MQCPYCRSYQTYCNDSRNNADGNFRRRRYVCKDCGMKFLTYEFIAKNVEEAYEGVKTIYERVQKHEQ